MEWEETDLEQDRQQDSFLLTSIRPGMGLKDTKEVQVDSLSDECAQISAEWDLQNVFTFRIVTRIELLQ